MTNEKVDIEDEVKALLSLEDSQTKQQLEISNLKLQKLKLEIEQETIRLQRLSKNNERRPSLFVFLCVLIGFFYFLFAAIVIYDIFAPCFLYVVPIKTRDYFHAAEVLALALVPTVLLIVLVKAIFAPQAKEDNKLSDVIPIKTLIQSMVDKNPS